MSLDSKITTVATKNTLDLSGFSFSAMPNHIQYDTEINSDGIRVAKLDSDNVPIIIRDFERPSLELIIESITDSIYSHFQNYGTLNDFSNVNATSPNNDNVLVRSSSNWIPKEILSTGNNSIYKVSSPLSIDSNELKLNYDSSYFYFVGGNFSIKTDGISHSELKPNTLLSDDHKQYLKLNGRTNGQIIKDNLVISGSSQKIGDGVDNYLEIESDGTLSFNGSATCWDDLRMPAQSLLKLGVKDPDFAQFKDDGSGSTGVYTYAFSASTEKELFFNIQMPHSWKEGSIIYPHVHWTPSDANTGYVVWALEYTWSNINSVYSNTTIISGAFDTTSTDRKHISSNLSSIDGSGKTISSMLICRLYRHGDSTSDTYNANAFLLEVDLHFEIDTIGSRLVSNKI